MKMIQFSIRPLWHKNKFRLGYAIFYLEVVTVADRKIFPQKRLEKLSFASIGAALIACT